MTSKVDRLKVSLLLPLVLLGSGCFSTEVNLDLEFGFSDVAVLEVYSYEFALSPTEVHMSVVSDRREIATWVSYLTDLPIEPVSIRTEDAFGVAADGFRFHLRDGTTYEVTHLFFGPKSSVLVWPDGQIVKSDYGSPTGYSGQRVDPRERPSAVLK